MTLTITGPTAFATPYGNLRAANGYGTGTVTIDGGTYTFSGIDTATGTGEGTLTITGGATVYVLTEVPNTYTYTNVRAAREDTSIGSVYLTGAGTTLSMSGVGGTRVEVSRFGDGLLEIRDGARVETLWVEVSRGQEGTPTNGELVVAGAGSLLLASGDNGAFEFDLLPENGGVPVLGGFFRAGRENDSTALVLVQDGGEIRVESSTDPIANPRSFAVAEIGQDTTSTGEMIVEGEGSRFGIEQIGPGGTGSFDGALLTIGQTGQGILRVRDGGRTEVLGDNAGIVLGLGEQGFEQTDRESLLEITAGGTVLVDGQSYGGTPATGAPGYTGAGIDIAFDTGSTARILVDGAGSSLEVRSDTDFAGDYFSDRIRVARAGDGALEVSNGGSVVAEALRIADQASGIGEDGAALTGQNVFLTEVTDAGSGRLSIASGGTVTVTTSDTTPTRGLYAALSTGTSADIDIDGAGSRLTVQGGTGRVELGRHGSADLTVSNGGTLAAHYAALGTARGGAGALTIAGAGSQAVFSSAYGSFFDTVNDALTPNTDGPSLSLGQGEAASGAVSVLDGGVLSIEGGAAGTTVRNGPDLRLGGDETGTGSLLISGEGSRLALTDQATIENEFFGAQLIVGDLGAGVGRVENGGSLEIASQRPLLTIGDQSGDANLLEVVSGGSVSVDSAGSTPGSILIGNETGSNGRVLVSGEGSALTLTQEGPAEPDSLNFLSVGRLGTASLEVADAGQVQSRAMVIGTYDGSDGTLTVSSGGTVELQTTATNPYTGLTAALDPGSSGRITVDGAGSSLLVSGDGASRLAVGNAGDTATLDVTNGGYVGAFNFDIGRDMVGALVTVSGAGSLLRAASDLGTFRDYLGPGEYGAALEDGAFIRLGRNEGSEAALVIDDGGTVELLADIADDRSGPGMQLGRNQGSRGDLTVTGAGSTLRIAQTGGDAAALSPFLRVGDRGSSQDSGGGTGTALVADGARVEVTGAGALVTVGRGDPGLPEAGEASRASSLAIEGGGVVSLDASGTSRAGTVLIGDEFGADGTLSITGGGSALEIAQGFGSVAVGRDGTGNLALSAGGRLAAGGLSVGSPVSGTAQGSGGVSATGGATEISLLPGDGAGDGSGDGRLAVGENGGVGRLVLSDGAGLTAREIALGDGTGLGQGDAPIGADGEITLSGGATATVDEEGPISIGRDGSGRVALSDGASLTGGNLVLGRSDTAGVLGTGSLTATGTGTRVDLLSESDPANGRLTLGSGGTGTLALSDGAALTAREIRIADGFAFGGETPAGSYGGLVVSSGASVTLDDDGSFYGLTYDGLVVGDGGTGSLTIDGADSRLVVAGTGSARIASATDAGSSGAISVTDGGYLGGFFLSLAASGTSEITVSGEGSLLRSASSLGSFNEFESFEPDAALIAPRDYGAVMRIGRNEGSEGRLTVSAGGRVEVVNDVAERSGATLRLGREQGATGEVVVDGAGSTLLVSESGSGGAGIELGGQPGALAPTAGTGRLTVSNGGRVDVTGPGASLIVGESDPGPDVPGALSRESRVTIEAGGQLRLDATGTDRPAEVIIGRNEESRGAIDVSGPGALFEIVEGYGTLFVGFGGAGALTLSDGASAIAGATVAGALGRLDLDGSLSGDLSVQGALEIGGDAAGSLSVTGNFRLLPGAQFALDPGDRLEITGNADFALGDAAIAADEDTALAVGEALQVATVGGTLVEGRAAIGTGDALIDLVAEGSLVFMTAGSEVSVDQAQTVALLYEAAFDRDGDIDETGLNFWIDRREGDGGPALTERELAAAFLASDEFIAAFGQISGIESEELVRLLYRNILDREGEAEGVAFWTGLLEDPAGDFAPPDALLAFAESSENREATPLVDTLAEVDDGVWAFPG